VRYYDQVTVTFLLISHLHLVFQTFFHCHLYHYSNIARSLFPSRLFPPQVFVSTALTWRTSSNRFLVSASLSVNFQFRPRAVDKAVLYWFEELLYYSALFFVWYDTFSSGFYSSVPVFTLSLWRVNVRINIRVVVRPPCHRWYLPFTQITISNCMWNWTNINKRRELTNTWWRIFR